MRRYRSLLCAAALLCTAACATVSAQRERPESAMADAARAFLAALDADQRTKTLIPFNSDERLNWHFVPKTGERKGLPLKEMNAAQQKAAGELLRAGLSQMGYDKVTSIRALEAVLRQVENNPRVRDPELYYFSIFGEPSDKGTWGWRYEGHHCSLNWTIVKGRSVASTPQFLGTNPAEVRVEVPNAPRRGTRVLGKEEDLARSLVRSLSAEQAAAAILSREAPRDIITGAERQASILEHKGVAYKDLNSEQQGILLSLIQLYADAQPRMLAQQRIARIKKAGLDQVKFAWMGGVDRNQGHYYRVQGPTFLIEYDNTQNNANHVHCVWRDFKGDWGMDLLAAHYHSHPHKVASAR